MGLYIRHCHCTVCALLLLCNNFPRHIFKFAVLDLVNRSDAVSPGQHVISEANENFTCQIYDVKHITKVNTSIKGPLTHTTLRYDWSERDVGLLESGYFAGYTGAMLLSTDFLMFYFGWFYGNLILLTSNIFMVFSFPYVTLHFGYGGAFLNRFLQGVAHGPVTSMIAASMYYWTLPSELATMNSVVGVGAGVAFAASSILSGFMINYGYGWEKLYYTSGCIMLIVLIVYFSFACSAPERKPSVLDPLRPMRLSALITEAEKNLIVDSRVSKRSIIKQRVDWKIVLKSKNVWCLALCWFFVQTNILTYHHAFIRFQQYLAFINIAQVGTFRALGTLLLIFLTIPLSVLVDKIGGSFGIHRVRRYLVILTLIMSCIGYFPPLLNPCNEYLNLSSGVLLYFFVAISIIMAIKPACVEMGGELSGQIYAATNTFSNFGGILGPYIVGYLLDLGPIYDIKTWYPVFTFWAAFMCAATLIFCVGEYTWVDWANYDIHSVPKRNDQESECSLKVPQL